MSKKALAYLINEIYSIPTPNESYIDKIIRNTKEIEMNEKTYTEDDVRSIIRMAQIRDENGIFLYPNENELLNLKLKLWK
jgi:hypothetical protein